MSIPVAAMLPRDGTITASQFRQGAFNLIQKSNTNIDRHGYPDWCWVSCSSSPFAFAHEVDGYLSLENACLFGSEKLCHDEADVAGHEAVSSFENEEFADSATLVVDSSREEHYYDFHIVYNSSYKVPMLYFRGYSSDGQPLQFDDIEKDLPSSSAKVLTESKWTFITQQEHPYLNRPWFTLHPCGTSEVMRLLFQDSALGPNIVVEGERYLISWLSVVGQVVGLRIPIEMVTLFHQVNELILIAV